MVRSCWVALSLLATTSLLACFPDPPRRDDTVDGDQDTAADTQDSFSPDTALPIDTQPAGDVADTDDVDALNVCAGGCAHLDGPCVSGACEHGECVVAPASSGSCDDGNACTTDDHCSAGACVGVAVVCEPASQCHDPGTCDPSTGTCSKPERPWDASCDSGTTYPGFCRNGTCKPRMVAIGEDSTCLLIHGVVRCWGDRNRAARDQAVYSFDQDVIEIAVGKDTCVLLADRTVVCWGTRVADSFSVSGAQPSPLAKVKAIRVGLWTACAIVGEDRRVRCWSRSASPLLGPDAAGAVEYSHVLDVPPIPIAHPVIALSVSGSHACAVDDQGKLWCWGYGNTGALGYGSVEDRGGAMEDFATPVPLGVLASDVVVGNGWSCATTPTGAVRCWGGLLSHGNGAIYGDDEPASAGGSIQLGGAATSLSTSSTASWHTCVVMTDGRVRCWGKGAFGSPIQSSGWLGYEDAQTIGDDEKPNARNFLNLAEPVVLVAAGGPSDSATCAIGESGKLYCWGSADLLGYGDGSDRGGSPGSMPPPPVPFE